MDLTADHHRPAPQIAVLRAKDTIRTSAGGPSAEILVTMTSADRKFETGFSHVGPEHEEYLGDGYENDEFCYILTGSVLLTAANGQIAKLGPGDSVSIPRGWLGRWDSDGYTKFWVMYYGKR